VVETRINARSSRLQKWPTVSWISTLVHTVANPVLLPLSYPTIPSRIDMYTDPKTIVPHITHLFSGNALSPLIVISEICFRIYR